MLHHHFQHQTVAIFARGSCGSLRQAMHKWDLGYWHEWRRATGLQGIGGIGYDQQMAEKSVFSSNLGGI